MSTKETKHLDDLSKEEVADIAAMLFNYQCLGPTVILELAETLPWLVERAPKPHEMAGLLDLTRRGKTIMEPDDRYNAIVARERVR